MAVDTDAAGPTAGAHTRIRGAASLGSYIRRISSARLLWCVALLAHVLCLDGSSVQGQRDRPAGARHNAKGQSDTDEEGSGYEWNQQGGLRQQRVCAHRQCRETGQVCRPPRNHELGCICCDVGSFRPRIRVDWTQFFIPQRHARSLLGPLPANLRCHVESRRDVKAGTLRVSAELSNGSQFADVMELKMAAVASQPVQFFCRTHKKPGQMLPHTAMRSCQRVSSPSSSNSLGPESSFVIS